jgi:hypothetical protein
VRAVDARSIDKQSFKLITLEYHKKVGWVVKLWLSLKRLESQLAEEYSQLLF